MDVKTLFQAHGEPAMTGRLRELLERVEARLTSAQRENMARWDDTVPHAAESINGVRNDVESPDRLRERARRFASAAGIPSGAFDDRIGDLCRIVADAPTKPAVASSIIWLLLGNLDQEFASHLVQVIRERSGLPRLTSPIRNQDLVAAAVTDKLPSLIGFFSDRQVADSGERIESISAPFGADDASTLNDQVVAIARVREAQPRVAPALFAAFARRAAAFLVELSTRQLDPVGFPLSREVQLEGEPSSARRVEIAAWARRVGHVVSPSGALLVLGIPIQAPWPWRLELIAGEPGHGASGCLSVLLRIVGDGTPPSSGRVPAFLLVNDEPDAERGSRFERWLAIAFPYATAEWRPWM